MKVRQGGNRGNRATTVLHERITERFSENVKFVRLFFYLGSTSFHHTD